MIAQDYEWKRGSRKQGNPQTVGEELERLRKRNKGRLSADYVVAEATHEDSPLHDYFEWDQDKAAHQHRLWQARELIATVVVKYETPDNEEKRTRYYVAVPPTKNGPYVPIQQAMSNEDQREFLLRKALRELDRIQRQYEQLEELADIFEALQRVKETSK